MHALRRGGVGRRLHRGLRRRIPRIRQVDRRPSRTRRIRRRQATGADQVAHRGLPLPTLRPPGTLRRGTGLNPRPAPAQRSKPPPSDRPQPMTRRLRPVAGDLRPHPPVRRLLTVGALLSGGRQRSVHDVGGDRRVDALAAAERAVPLALEGQEGRIGKVPGQFLGRRVQRAEVRSVGDAQVVEFLVADRTAQDVHVPGRVAGSHEWGTNLGSSAAPLRRSIPAARTNTVAAGMERRRGAARKELITRQGIPLDGSCRHGDIPAPGIPSKWRGSLALPVVNRRMGCGRPDRRSVRGVRRRGRRIGGCRCRRARGCLPP